MNQSDLTRAVAAQANLSMAAANCAVEATFSTITKIVADNQLVQLSGFGSFQVPRRFELVDDSNSRFFEISVEGDYVLRESLELLAKRATKVNRSIEMRPL